MTQGIEQVSFLVCVALIIDALIPRTSTGRKRLDHRWWFLSLIATLEYVSIAIWLSFALPILAWMFWIGDNDHWFYHYAWIFAAGIGVAVSAISALRIRNGNATILYERIHLWTPLLLIVLFSGLWGCEFAQRIEGTTAESAASNILEQIRGFDEPVRLVECLEPPPFGADPMRSKTYWVMGFKEPRGRISVSRYGYFWWTHGSYEGFPPSQKELDRAKDWLKDSAMRHDAFRVLRSIQDNYPNTPAADEAKKLLLSRGEGTP